MKKFGSGRSDKWEAFSNVIVSADNRYCSIEVLTDLVYGEESKRDHPCDHDQMVSITLGVE
jgi:hypothetical protein